MSNKLLNDINSFKELERIPNPELIDDNDLLIIQTEDGELKSVKYKDLGEGISKDGIIGDTGPQGPQGEPGVEIVEEFGDPDESSIIWIKEGISPEEEIANNIESYIYEFFMAGEEDPNHNPQVSDKTMIYFKIDDTLPESNIRIIKVPNNESDMQKQLDALHQRIDKLPEVFVQSQLDDVDIDDGIPPDDYELKLNYPSIELISDKTDIMIGSSETLIITPVYHKNDGGSAILHRLYVDNKLYCYGNKLPESFELKDIKFSKDIKIRIEIEYLRGPEIYPDTPYGYVDNGVCSCEIEINVGYPYWGVTLDQANDDVILDMNHYTGIDIHGRDKIIVNTNDQDMSIIFAYPKSLGDCYEINYVGFDINNKDAFDTIEKTLTINGEDVEYYVYYYNALIPIGKARFVLTI